MTDTSLGVKDPMEKAIALRVPHNPALVAKIRRQGWVPLPGKPHHLTPRGGMIVLVGDGGEVLLAGRVRQVQAPVPVTLVDGTRLNNRCKVHATWYGKTKFIEPLYIGFRVEGQMRYFDPERWRPTIVGEVDYPASAVEPAEHLGRGPMRVVDLGFRGAHPGLKPGTPELDLVKDYRDWIGSEETFWTQHRLEPDGLYTDLFDRTHWRLFEAKVPRDPALMRRTLRTGVGQLLDYKRFFARAPSIGVLLPFRPQSREQQYLDDVRVVAIWRTASNQFRDSDDGRWTLGRRVRV